MPLISNPTNFFCETHFVFQGNDIIISDGEGTGKTMGQESLPPEEALRRMLSSNIVSDWFAEPDMNYSAMMVEDAAPLPGGMRAIPLRHFFWQTKTKAEQDAGLPSALGAMAARAHGFLRLRESCRFCPTCGAPLTDDSELTAKRCTSCGRLLFPRIEPAVIVLVTRTADTEEEVLLVRSKTVPHKNFAYSCVAGFVEHGETAEQCVVREVKEETGIDVKNVRYAGSQAWPFPDQLMLAFTAEYAGGEIVIQESEIEEAKWFPRTSLPSVPLPGSVAYNLIMGKFPGAKSGSRVPID